VLSVDIIAASCLLLDPWGVSVLDYIRGVFNWISSLLEVPLILISICWLIVLIAAAAVIVILLFRDYYLSCIERSG
jgi:hypothetical protein